MKNIVKQLATGTFIALLLLAGNVKAEGTERTASSHETIETTLQLENWMTDESYWSTDSYSAADFSFETETETELQLENWMTSDELWGDLETDTEEALTLESWMTDAEVWK